MRLSYLLDSIITRNSTRKAPSTINGRIVTSGKPFTMTIPMPLKLTPLHRWSGTIWKIPCPGKRAPKVKQLLANSLRMPTCRNNNKCTNERNDGVHVAVDCGARSGFRSAQQLATTATGTPMARAPTTLPPKKSPFVNAATISPTITPTIKPATSPKIQKYCRCTTVSHAPFTGGYPRAGSRHLLI